ncbi:hypothetical protein AHAS_Ahas05G0158100 [Arachis hypogaea]
MERIGGCGLLMSTKKNSMSLTLSISQKKDIRESRVQLNKFGGLIISQMRVYAGAEPLIEDGLGEEAGYIQLNGQHTK